MFLGTLVNAAAVVLAAALGLRAGHRLRPQHRQLALRVIGAAVVVMGVRELLQTEAPALVLVAVLGGGAAGAAVALQARTEQLGRRLEAWMRSHMAVEASNEGQEGGEPGRAAVTATLLFCVGPLAILGGLEGGMAGRHDLLLLKSVLDGVSGFFLAATLGIGVMAAAIPLFFYQGAWVVVGALGGALLHGPVLREFAATGGLMVAVIGLNLLGLRHIQAVDLLPGLLLVILLGHSWPL